jgi:hypothetical protein
VIPDGVQVFVAVEPVDLRAGFDRLAGFARDAIGLEPSQSALFVFFGRRRDTVKVIFLDRTGRCLFHKRLHRGTFAQLTALHPPRSSRRARPDRVRGPARRAADPTACDEIKIHDSLNFY